MSTSPSTQSPSTIRRVFAIGLGVVTLLFPLLYWLVYGFVAMH